MATYFGSLWPFGSRSGLRDDHRKVLMIGETGSGKTSFLNLLCNCNLIKTYGYAEGSKRFDRFNDIKLEDPEAKQMQSKTRAVTAYVVQFSGLQLCVLDTPGFGDSRGMKFDQEHMDEIVVALESEERVDCICLIINGRYARMSATTKYVLTQITSILPRVPLENIIVVFTNTCDILDLNFDVQELAEFFGTNFDSVVFKIENPYCKIEKAKAMKGKLPVDKIVQELERAFQETSDELEKMIDTIRKFNRIYTKEFLKLYNKKQEIERTVHETLAAYDTQLKLEKEITAAVERVNAALGKRKLNSDFRSTLTHVRIKTVETDSHNTLCGAKGCYSNCHESCTLEKMMDKDQFWRCACMKEPEREYCEQCQHHYKLHFHNEVIWKRENYTEEIIDEEMKKKFQEADSMAERETMIKRKLSRKQRRSEDERKMLSIRLRDAIQEFETLGITRSYAKVLETQLAVIEEHLEGEVDQKTNDLKQTKTELKKRLHVVLKHCSGRGVLVHSFTRPWQHTLVA